MSQPESSNDLSHPGNETQVLIRHIRKKKWKYIIIVVVSGLFSFYIIKFLLFEHSSTASFFVNDRDVINNTSQENLPYGDNLNRIFQMANSTQTHIHLINKFKLYEHYKIDSTKEFHLQSAIECIRSKIDVKKNPYNAIIVTVRDRNRVQAADMANEIVAYIEKLNQDYFIKNLQNSVKLSQAYLSQLEQESRQKSMLIDSLIKDINRTINSGHISNAILYYLLMQQHKLSEIVGEFEASSNEILNANKLYSLSLQTMNFNNFPTISVIQTAMPDLKTGNLNALLLSLLVMILLFLFLIIQAYFIIHYNGYLNLLLTGKQSIAQTP